MRVLTKPALLVIMLLACTSPAQAEVVVSWIAVGDPGNVDGSHGDGYGGVEHRYSIGKYEVTNDQYVEFLNAVATVGDPHGLYSTEMDDGWNGIGGISRSGSGMPGNPWVYETRPGRGNRPVNYVSWYDAVRFANWMHNGQPTGTQEASTTEDGAYDMSLSAGVVRKPGARVFLPSEDEWYKAAYYKGGGTAAGYWQYPTQSDIAPTPEAPPGMDLVNGSANYYSGGFVDPTYYTTEVGTYIGRPSDSAYGTFDQGGNMWEWNEADIFGDGSYRGMRGGSFWGDDNDLSAEIRQMNTATSESKYIGFRVAGIPPQDAGDLNCDGWVNNGDIDAFVFALSYPELYATEYPNCSIMNGDINNDGWMNNGDIDQFVALLTGSPPPPGMVLITGGEFEMGCHAETGEICHPPVLPVHTVYVDWFYIDVYEVTNQKYCSYLNAAHPSQIKVVDGVVYGVADSSNSYPYCGTYPYSDWSCVRFSDGAFTITLDKENHPMLEVTWYGAVAYANWRSEQEGRRLSYNPSTWTCNFAADGYRLPTDAEREYAARGGQHNPYYAYPWGNTMDGSKANYMNSGAPYESGDYPWTTPVGYYNGGQVPPGVDMANGYGLYDMVGNAYEWCNDWYDANYYDVSPYNNPHGPASGTSRVVRGGSWNNANYDDTMRCALRGGGTPGFPIKNFGFRLVLD